MPQKDCFERRWTPHEKQIKLIHHAVHIWLLPERRRDRLTAEVTSHILLPGILKLGRAKSQTSIAGTNSSRNWLIRSHLYSDTMSPPPALSLPS